MTTDYFLDKPSQIKISLTNLCNFRCVMCVNPELAQPRGFIAESLIRKLVDECSREGIPKISLGGTGEPLLHNQFVDFLAYAKSRGLWVSTTTNGSLLSPEKAAAILAAGIDRIHVSLYSSSSEEHLAYTKTKTFESTSNNIRRFLQLWASLGKPCELGFSFLDINGVNQKDRFLAYWQPIFAEHGATIGHHALMNWAGKRQDLVQRGGQSFMTVPCEHVRNYLHILHDGTVLPCCNIMEVGERGEVDFGNAKDCSIIEIWHSEKYLRFKRAQFSRNLQEYPTCNKCSEILAPRRSWITALQSLPARLTRRFSSRA